MKAFCDTKREIVKCTFCTSGFKTVRELNSRTRSVRLANELFRPGFIQKFPIKRKICLQLMFRFRFQFGLFVTQSYYTTLEDFYYIQT